MKVTKSQLQQIIKEEIEKARLHDRPARREGTPPWYSAPGGVADRIQEMANEVKRMLDDHEERLNALENTEPPAVEDPEQIITGDDMQWNKGMA